ncbi:MAG TPA: outer membrane protein assembly factor BamD [Steroidobacteraceae bacterium]|nr:outer membrane protein assembly factor BamD [Steroidobacteraceae bacterium]
MNSPTRSTVGSLRLPGILLCAALALFAGCASNSKKDDLKRASVETLYAKARKALKNNDYEYAIKQYEALTSRFPFTDQARQARLDLIYLYYRKGEKESAIDAADEFLRENPTHPRVDYAWYMKGMINYEPKTYKIQRWLGVDMARRPPSTLNDAISAFNTVVKQYPKSPYAHDSLRRMIYLRNRLAEYELYIARFYVRRGAYLAAAQRANGIIEQYDGAPQEQEALEIMEDCYTRLGMTEQAMNTERVYKENFPEGRKIAAADHHWWKFW